MIGDGAISRQIFLSFTGQILENFIDMLGVDTRDASGSSMLLDGRSNIATAFSFRAKALSCLARFLEVVFAEQPVSSPEQEWNVMLQAFRSKASAAAKHIVVSREYPVQTKTSITRPNICIGVCYIA